MSKYFRPWNIDQTLLLPPNVQDFVPKGHVSRFIVELVRESLDLKEITGSYVSGLGQPPFDPRMMVALLLKRRVAFATPRQEILLRSNAQAIRPNSPRYARSLLSYSTGAPSSFR